MVYLIVCFFVLFLSRHYSVYIEKIGLPVFHIVIYLFVFGVCWGGNLWQVFQNGTLLFDPFQLDLHFNEYERVGAIIILIIHGILIPHKNKKD